MTPTILVVEDEPAIQELVVINLKHAGFLVVRAGSAEEAESAIRAALPDLVILDWMLPGQSGVTPSRFHPRSWWPACVPCYVAARHTWPARQ